MKHLDILSELCGGSARHDRWRKIYLTFDDGPDPVWTPLVLDVLAQHEVPATFCILGAHAAQYPTLVKRMMVEGHEIANHTMWHRDLSKITPAEVRREIVDTTAIIAGICPTVAIRYMRAPYGIWTEDVIAESAKAGLMPLRWSVDPLDWALPGVDAIIDAVLAAVRPNSIVLMHDGIPPGELITHAHTATREQTVIALSRLIPALKERDFVISALPP